MNFLQVQKIVNKYDPLRLIAIGCPKDEYRAEIKDIKERLSKEQSQIEMEGVVIKVFTRWFGKELIRDRENNQLKKIARDLSKLSS